MKNVLFVCTENTCRSPMAQGIMEKIAFDRRLPIRTESAGLSTQSGKPVSVNAVEACKEIGVDISRYRTMNVRDLDLSTFDAIFTMTTRHKSALVALGANPYKISVLDTEEGGVPDPKGGDLDAYRQCRNMISEAVENALKEI